MPTQSPRIVNRKPLIPLWREAVIVAGVLVILTLSVFGLAFLVRIVLGVAR